MNHLLRWQMIAVGMILCFTGSAFAQTSPPGSDIYLAPLSPGGRSLAVGELVNVTKRPGYDNQPSFSPDGSFFLYTSIDTSGQADIYRYDIDAWASTRVTATAESEYSPVVMPGADGFSTVRVESDGTQRLWQFDLDGTNPRFILASVDSVGYYAWVDDNTLAVFVLGEPHTLRIVDRIEGTDRLVALDIGRCLNTVPATGTVAFVQNVSAAESWITLFRPESGALERLVQPLPESQDFAWTPDRGILMASGSGLFLWTIANKWRQVGIFTALGIENITRLAVSPNGRMIALVADDK